MSCGSCTRSSARPSRSSRSRARWRTTPSRRRTTTSCALRAHHARSAIVDRLRLDFAEKHVELAHLDDLYEWIGLLSKHWYRQGGMDLGRVEALRVRLALYEWRVRAIRRRSGGRAPSVAWDFLVSAP